jgi:carboxyl-terminal processing protease
MAGGADNEDMGLVSGQARARQWRGVAIAAVMLLVACAPAGEAPTEDATTVASPAGSPTPASPEAATAARSLHLIGCDPVDPEVEIVCEAYDLVRRHYVDRVPDQDLARAAARGLRQLDGATSESEIVCPAPATPFIDTCNLALEEAETSTEAAEAMVRGIATYGLDPYSVYFDPEALDLVEEEQAGEIQGIGAMVTAEHPETGEACNVISATCEMSIVSTIEGTPADEAGLQPDDLVLAVDGADIDGWTVDEVTAVVRGPAGTVVVLTVEREGRVFDVTITRAAVIVPVVESEVVGTTGYIALSTFTDSADELFQDALADLLARDVDGLVVDLRNNPGGLLDTAIEVTSAFLPDGDVVITEGPDSSTSYPVAGDPLVPPDVAVVVVVNKASASASEVVSAVLQERGRATIVGENTFGKNTVQQRFALSNGGALKLTIARWLTPEGHDFGSVGVTPNVSNDIATQLPVERVVQEALASSMTLAG